MAVYVLTLHGTAVYDTVSLSRNSMATQKLQRSLSVAWRRHQDALEAAYARIDAMRARDRLNWVFQFRKTDLQTLSPAERRGLGYELRALARSVGGWSFLDEPRPLDDQELRTVQEQIRDGLRALNEIRKRPDKAPMRLHTALNHKGAFWQCKEPACVTSATALRAAMTDPTATSLAHGAGWRLPAHRVRLRRFPKQTDDPAEHTAIVAIYESRDELSAIVVAIGHFVSREWSRWRTCPCGCGAWYVPTARQIYYEPACENRARARRRRDEERRKREARQREKAQEEAESAQIEHLRKRPKPKVNRSERGERR
jgi:hypothetical protein